MTVAPGALSALSSIIRGMPLRSGALVGRDADLARLHDAVGLDTGRGGVVVLAGDAGIGKTRLVSQLVEDATAAGWLTATGHCVGQAGSSLAHLPFVELLGGLDAGHGHLVDQALGAHPSLAHLLPARGDRLEASTESASGAAHRDRAGPTVEPGRVAESVHALLTALGVEQPTLIVVEDVHWADHSSRDLLTLLLTRGFSSRLALVVTYRSDDLHRRHPLHETLAVWARIASVEHVELEPLGDEAVRTLVRSLERAPADGATAIEIARRAEGNPFFAEELAASAAAGRALSGGLTRVLNARVEQLGDTAQHVVRVVAMAGHRLGHDLLARVAALPDDELEGAIRGAVEHHVLETSWPPAYTFRHALLGEAVADGLLPGERLRLHRAYAAVLVEHPGLAPASELARHAAAIGDLPAAVEASLAAADAALAVGGPQDALQHYERVLSWLADDDPLRDEVTLRASDAAMVAGDAVRAVDLVRDRLDHGAGQRPEARADLLARHVMRSRTLDLPVDALSLTREAVRLVGEVSDERRVRVLVAHLQALVDAEAFTEAAAVADEVTELAERLGMRRALTEVRTIVTWAIAARNDLGAVEAHLRSVISDLGDDDPVQLRARHQLASVLHRRGELKGSLAEYDRTAEIARRMRREWAPWGQESRYLGALVCYEIGDWDAAERRLVVIDQAPQPGRSIFRAARLAVAAGRGEAIDPAVFAQLREWWDVDGLCVVLTVMAGIDLLGDAGDIDGAVDLARDAVEVLDAAWGDYDALVRIAALVAGQAATAAARANTSTRRHLVDMVDGWTARARTTVADQSRAALEQSSTETWAWAARLEAEVLRLRRAAALDDPPAAAELVAAWQVSVDAFTAYGHVFETARSTARLAEALLAGGWLDEGRAATDRARTVAAALGARPLLAEIHALDGPHRSRQRDASSDGLELTPREVEVLALLARGLSNGQIGKQLFISTKTVSVHVSNLLAKLGASGRTEAAAVARERGLLG